MASWRSRAQAGRGGFVGFSESGEYIPPRRLSSAATRFPQWCDPVPKSYKYPWTDLRLPMTRNAQEAQRTAAEMKACGNESFRRGDTYDALWKYEHALLLCHSYPSLKADTAALHSNIAAVCLKLGDAGSEDLLDPQQYPPSHVLWYAFTQQHASEAITLCPEAKILHKAYYRRGESLKKMISIPEMRNTMQAMAHIMPSLFPPQSDPYLQMVYDFIQCFQLQDSPEPRIVCDALMVAVDNGHTRLLPTFRDKHIDSGFTSQLLFELVTHETSTSEHINYLLFKIKVDSKRAPNLFYNASKIMPSQLLRKGIRELKVYELLIDYGMPVMAEDIAYAVHVLPNSKHELMKLLVSKCEDCGDAAFEKAVDTAVKGNKKQFVTALKGGTKFLFDQLKEEGNSYFQQGKYSEALGKYFQALNHSRQHNMKEQMALIRANCAMACLKLQMYSDAYTHCMECVKLDPENHKGYFRRAEALKGILSSPMDGKAPGSYRDVVNDYVKCHKLHSNLDAFFNAVTIGHEYKLTGLIPHISQDDVTSGLSTKLLRQVVDKQDVNESLLKYVVFKLPLVTVKQPYDASGVDLVRILSKSTDCKLIERLLDLGMKLKPSQMEATVLFIPRGDLATFELLLKYAKRNNFTQTSLNAACMKAMESLKVDFIAQLIECGAAPPPDELVRVVGLSDNPIIQQYLALQTTHEPVENPYKDLFEDRDHDEDTAYEKEVVRELNAEAKNYYKELKDHKGALERYFKALDICKKSRMTEEAAAIHGNCAHLLLQQDSYYQAYKHADACIKLNPSYDKAYIRRADSLRKALQSGRFEVPANLTYENVITDYCKGHGIKSNVKAFVEAILVAIDNDRSGMVIHIRRMALDFCNKVLVEILSRKECKQAHLEFLVSKMWNEKEINVSKVTLKQLIVDREITSESLLQRFLELGLPLTKEDIKMAITSLRPTQMHLFRYIVAKCNPADLDELCQAAVSSNRMTFVLYLVERGAKLPSHGSELLIHALKTEDYDGALALAKKFTKATMDKLDLATLMDSNIVNCPELIKVLVDRGLSPNGKGRKTPISVMMAKAISATKKIDMICLLLEIGEDCNHLSNTGKSTTTPLHVATELGLQSGGDLRLIGSVVCSPTFNLNKMANDKGESPLHMAIKSHWKKDLSTLVLSALLETNLLDPSKRDQSGKRPLDYLGKSDSRIAMLEEAVRKFKPESSQKQKKQKKKKGKGGGSTSDASSTTSSQKEVEKVNSQHPSSESSWRMREKEEPKAEPVYAELTTPNKVEFHIKRLMAKGSSYFQVEVTVTASYDVASSPEEEAPKMLEAGPSDDKEIVQKGVKFSEEKEVASVDKKDKQKVSKVVNVLPSNDISAILTEHADGLDFDKLPWEVEVTAKVVKFFKNRKKSSSDIRGAAAKIIYRLAEGRRSEHLSKLVSREKSLQLYEARMTKAARILWEKAISYSAILTGPSSIPVYSEVIRVWEIVLDHDNLERRIKYCTEQIEKSHLRGFDASVRWMLMPQKTSEAIEDGEKIRRRERSDIPVRFLLPSTSETKSKHQFIPAASTKDDEYNVTTFYSFDTIAFKSMLLGTNDRRDFPFKEWQKEHEIIKLTQREAILLLGRSGTGKTTCCLYRLWNEFKNFWNPESNTFGWKIPRRRLIPPAILVLSAEDTESKEDQEESDESGIESSTEEKTAPATKDPPSVAKSKVQELKFEEKVDDSPDECGATPISSATPTSASQGISPSPNANVFQVGENMEIIEENLHQVFITKNYVLCDQMKKRFYNMAAAFDFLDQHLKHEVTDLGNDLSKLDDCAFPLFLTARQFYILLDNSLCDGRAFFKRDEEGNLKVKITSLDYDHEDPDILLDLEHSDSEDEDMEGSSSNTTQSLSKGHTERWTEVTALYFKEFIWPSVSHQCGINSKDFDPLLVWIEIQSFIKGSESALRKGTHLSLEEYKLIGNRMAPNFSSHRDTIYKVFLKYQKFQQNQRHHNFIFDECDLVLHLYNRLKDVQDVQWSIHSLYIDEVQDFTQAELAIFIHCCRDPNSMFFTGDTAQSIMRGIAFRFQDLRSSFHRINSKIPAINVPQKPHNLTINFRSHSGILKLAGSIIDLISEFFKDSIDHLPDDEGMFPGPTPVLLESCKIDDLALLLSTNKREASAIEFGAHQVILVQSKEAKDNLPSILKGAIVLTIFEAKGLEFDDVLLYNFFTDSMVDEKGWRVISSYLEMSQHHGKIANPTKLPGSSDDPRSRQFDAKLHKSLNSELKYLYTAVTRAKCNLWIYDSDRKTRLPMFDYWHKRNLVKVVQAQPSKGSQGVYTLVFASNSTPEQWKAQGDNFKKKHLWEQAILCYQRAGPENEYLAKEARAYHLIQRARHQKPQLYLEAALSFLECDELHHNLHYINGAALCLRNSKPTKYHEAAKLFERLGESEKAAQSYLRGRDIDNYARLKESVGQHGEVVRALMGKPFMRKRDALAKASEYEKQGIKLHQDLSTSELSYSCAKFYSERRDKDTLIEVLTYMPEVSRKVKFLKEAKLYKEAFDSLTENKEFKEAYRLASAQGTSKQGSSSDSDETWLQKGLRIAKENKDEAMKASFIFQIAKVEYKQKGQQDKADSDVYKHLDALLRNKDQLIKAQAYLLLGMLKRDVTLCRTAWRTYHSVKHKVGELEAFNQIQQLASESDQSLLDVCHVAKETGNTLMKASDIVKVVKEALSFYGLQKIGVYYYTPPGQDIWIGEVLMKCVCNSSKTDLDGMLKLEASDARDELAKHCRNFKSTWLSRFDLRKKLEPKWRSFPLHRQLWEHRVLFREYSMEQVSSEALRNYIQTSVLLLELRSLREESTDALIALLVSIFTPRVYIYLPQRIKEDHVLTVRRSVNSHSLFRRFITATVQANGTSEKFPERVKADSWLVAWRACCISEPDLKCLIDMLQELEKEVNEKSKAQLPSGEKYQIPAGFIYWRKDQKFYHIFSFWLNSCVEMREKKRFLWSSKLAIYYFLGKIAEHPHECSITVINIVDILSIHCTGLLAMITHANVLQNRPTSCTIPLFYKNSVFVFSMINSWKKEDRWLLSACAEEVTSWRKNLGKLFNECRTLLISALGLLLGTNPHAPRYSVLKTGLRKIAATDASKQCLILALVLFGNLSLLRVRETREFHQQIQFLLKRSLSKDEKMPEYVTTTYRATMNPNFSNPAEVFKLVGILLQDARVDSTLARLVYKAKGGHHGRVEIVPMRTQQPAPTKPQMSTPLQTPPVPPPASTTGGSAPGQLNPGPMDSSKFVHSPNVPYAPQYPTAPGGNGVPFSAMPSPGVPYTSTTVSQQQPIGSRPPQTSVAYTAGQASASTMGQGSTGSEGYQPQVQLMGQAQEPIKARVVASYTADELKKLYMSAKTEEQQVPTPSVATGSYAPQPDAHVVGFAGPPGGNMEYAAEQPTLGQYEYAPYSFEVPEYVEQEQAQLEPESESREQEEDMSMTRTLTGGEQLLSQINPALIDPEIVTMNFCNACGVPLKFDQYLPFGGNEEQSTETDDAEPYHIHVSSEPHGSNVFLCKQFTAIMSDESGNELYPALKQALHDLLYDCQMLKTRYDTDKLDRAIDSIQEELEKNDVKISELEESRSWRMAIDKISKMVDTMDRLVKRYRQLYSQVSEELKRARRWRFGSEGGAEGDGGEIENREQQEMDQLSERFDSTDAPVTSNKGGGASGAKKLRSEEDKVKSRMKKKEKRRPGR